MSAYATSFFLPPASSVPSCQNETTLKKTNGESSSCSQAESVRTSPPLHLSDDEKPLALSTTSDSNAQLTKSYMRSRVPEILISVKSASVDPAGFVKAITSRGGDGKKRPLPRPGARPISNDEPKHPEASEISNQAHKPLISPKSDKARLRFADKNDDTCDRHESSSSSSCSSSSSSLHSHPEDAIRFELSISYAGRKYSATRTLNRLVRLRQDLMREIEERRPGFVVPKRSDSHHHRESLTDDDTDLTASISFDSDQSSGNAPRTFNRNAPPPVVVIPELPVAGSEMPNDAGSASRPQKDHRGLPKPSTTIDGSNGAAAGSLVSGSFTRLHMALVQYCPAVEDWFRRILTDILPDPESSPSLIAFLWEPLGAGEDDTGTNCRGKISASTTPGPGKHSMKGMGSKRHSSTRSICTLGSIDEQNCGEEEDEAADDDDRRNSEE